jgi:hypothetical protein
MSARQLPSAWEATRLYTLFDLRTLLDSPGAWIGMLLLPPLIAVFYGAVFQMFRAEVNAAELGPKDVWVVVWSDPSVHAALEAELREPWRAVEVHATDPVDLQARLEEGAVHVLVRGPADDLASLTVLPGPGIDQEQTSELRREVGLAVLDALVATRAGPAPRVAAVEEEVDEPFSTDNVLSYFGWFCIGCFGILLGSAASANLLQASRTGFNHVLAVGTRPRSIYMSEMLTGVLSMSGQAFGWVALYLFAAVASRPWTDLEPPPWDTALAASVILGPLTAAALVCSLSLSLLLRRMTEELPYQVREGMVQVLWFPVMVSVLVVGGDTTVLPGPSYAAAPVIGLPLTWDLFLDDHPLTLLLLGLHVGYALACLELGAWLYVIDETPQSWLRRRWGRRA